MRQAGCLAAAIDILGDIETRHRPAATALADWGRNHRFAGSSDRALIGNMVYDVLRQKASLSWRMSDDSPRAQTLGLMRFAWGLSVSQIDVFCDGGRHNPGELDTQERERLETGDIAGAPDWVAGDYPQWLHDQYVASFGDDLAVEACALGMRAPLDVRTNLLKANRAQVVKSLSRFKAEPTPYAPTGIRIPAGSRNGRSPNVQVEPGFQKGWFEIQDEGSQVSAMLAGAHPGAQVLDLCAGAGGKTLALAAAMNNKGQIHSFDNDRHRLVNIWQRLKRAGVRNAQVLDAGDDVALETLTARMDLVLIDAPCSGTGAWRRRPDAKWRFTPDLLDKRMAEQRAILARAGGLVKPGGRLAYITCSILPCENQDQIAWFLAENQAFKPLGPQDLWRTNICDTPYPGSIAGPGALLTPAKTGTDGFFVCVLEQSA